MMGTSPETGMGYAIVSAILKDDRRFDRVCVVGGVIWSVDGSDTIPFAESEIDRFVVTHDSRSAD